MKRNHAILATTLTILVALTVWLYPVPKSQAKAKTTAATSLKQIDPVNYDDPNMTAKAEFVAEATSACMDQGAKGQDMQSCMQGLNKSKEVETASTSEADTKAN